MRCGLWNTRGFVANDRLREGIIRKSDLDLVGICETFLCNKDGIEIDGYKWLGHNRQHISKRAVRGSGGVGLLIKDSMFNHFSIDIVDKQHEDILWTSFSYINNPDCCFLHMYMLPATSNFE